MENFILRLKHFKAVQSTIGWFHCSIASKVCHSIVKSVCADVKSVCADESAEAAGGPGSLPAGELGSRGGSVSVWSQVLLFSGNHALGEGKEIHPEQDPHPGLRAAWEKKWSSRVLEVYLHSVVKKGERDEEVISGSLGKEETVYRSLSLRITRVVSKFYCFNLRMNHPRLGQPRCHYQRENNEDEIQRRISGKEDFILLLSLSPSSPFEPNASFPWKD